VVGLCVENTNYIRSLDETNGNLKLIDADSRVLVTCRGLEISGANKFAAKFLNFIKDLLFPFVPFFS